MSVTYGFYNSNNGDRRYSAKQLSQLFDGIITDGVYANFGDHFEVTPVANALSVKVGTGRAWFNHTWTYVDTPYTMQLEPNSAAYPRIDVVVLEVDETSRINSLKIISGSPAQNPVWPSLPQTTTKHTYPLANVRVEAGATSIAANKISIRVGTAACPYVTNAVDNLAEVIDQKVAEMMALYLEDDGSALYSKIDELTPLECVFAYSNNTASCTINGINALSDVVAAYQSGKPVVGKFVPPEAIRTVGQNQVTDYELHCEGPRYALPTIYEIVFDFIDYHTGAHHVFTIYKPAGSQSVNINYTKHYTPAPYIITFSYDETNNTGYCDRSIAEIETAYFEGRQLAARYQISASGASYVYYFDLMLNITKPYNANEITNLRAWRTEIWPNGSNLADWSWECIAFTMYRDGRIFVSKEDL